MTPKILAFAGSLRKGSWNKMLVRTAVEGAQAAGAEVTHIDLADYRMPVPGLYLCGSGAHPGGGVTGAPGHNCARAVLRDLGRW